MPTGTDLVRPATRHVGESYILGVVAPKHNAAWRGPWDCAEFTSWCVFQTAGHLYGCNNNSNAMLADAYTGFWHRDAVSIGKRIDVAAAATIPGAAVLRVFQVSEGLVADGEVGKQTARALGVPLP